ncbi:hypothetical protein OAQ84_00450 [Bdellovibrionales bacterium]|nr:hypothetical protein [Bdellovibrionales bacterium]
MKKLTITFFTTITLLCSLNSAFAGESRLSFHALPWVAEILQDVATEFKIKKSDSIQSINFEMDEPLTGLTITVVTIRKSIIEDTTVKIKCEIKVFTPYTKENGLTSTGGSANQKRCTDL